MKVSLVSLTNSTLLPSRSGDEHSYECLSTEELIVYAARVSNPANQMNHETAPRLIHHLIKSGHWSPFEMANMCLEVITSRGIAPQILRHRSFSFQEFSQRYAEAVDVEVYKARRQDSKNRQNSIDDMSPEDITWFIDAQAAVWAQSFDLYKQALARGIAKEQARFLLPLGTQTKLYINGTIRSWIHYLQARTAEGVQKEHRDIALEAQKIFIEHFPNIAQALEWK